MYDVITIGSATVDIFMKSAEFHLQPTSEGVLLCQAYGGKLDIDHFEMQSGGAGTNTAVAFARMGYTTAAVVEIGKDIFGQVVWDDLKREHVDTSFVVSERLEQTAVSVLLISADGGRSALTHRGASALLEPRDMPWQALRETRWIHLSNCAGQQTLLLRLFEHVRHSLVGVSWNPGMKELELVATGQMHVGAIACDIVFMNQAEWQVVAPQQAALRAHIPIIVITDGKKGGTVLLKNGTVFTFIGKDVPTVQETGAGDAFASGFVSGYLQGKSPQESALWGVNNAASVVGQMGAKTGLLRKAQMIDALIGNHVRL